MIGDFGFGLSLRGSLVREEGTFIIVLINYYNNIIITFLRFRLERGFGVLGFWG